MPDHKRCLIVRGIGFLPKYLMGKGFPALQGQEVNVCYGIVGKMETLVKRI
jgi:hypothetical protein